MLALGFLVSEGGSLDGCPQSLFCSDIGKLNTINFPLNTAFAESHTFDELCFLLFSHLVQIVSISLEFLFDSCVLERAGFLAVVSIFGGGLWLWFSSGILVLVRD